MIDESKIKEAAGEWAAEHPSPRPNVFEDKKEGFIHGVLWAQQEFVKTLWHDAKGVPENNAAVLAIGKIGNSSTLRIDGNYLDWKDEVEMWNIIKWCYLSDILPKEGGEK